MPPFPKSQCANCTCGFSSQNNIKFAKILFEDNVELDIGDALSYIYGKNPLSKSDSKYPSIFQFCGSCVFLLENAYTALRHFENTSHLNSEVGRFKDKCMAQRLSFSTTENLHPTTSPIQSYGFGDEEQSDAEKLLDELEVDEFKYLPNEHDVSNNSTEENEWGAVENKAITADQIESQCKNKLVVKLERLSPDILRDPIPEPALSKLTHIRRRTRRPATYEENYDDEETENMKACPKMEIEQEEDNAWSPSESEDPNEIQRVVQQSKRKSSSPVKKRKRTEKKSKKCTVKKVCKSDVKFPVCDKMVKGRNGDTSSHMRSHSSEKPFVCHECGEAFRYAGGSLNEHLRFCHGILVKTKRTDPNLTEAAVANEHAASKRVYFCEVCTYDFNYKYRFLRHLKDKHLNKQIEDGYTVQFYYCDFVDCKASFPTLDRLQTHLSVVHSSSNSFKCNDCQHVFSQECNLKIHSTSHEENNSKCACKYCHMVFDTEMELADHTPRHEIKLDMSTYCHVCDQCGEAFQNQQMLKKHQFNMHSGKVKARPQKQKSTVKEAGLPKHRSNSKFFCETCDKTVWAYSLRSHMYSHTNPDGFQCPHCPYKAPKPRLLRNHQIRHHSMPQTDSRVSAGDNNEAVGVNQQPINIPCEYCDLIFKSRFRYRKHLLDKHSEKFPNLNFPCNACYCLFESEELLTAHIDQLHERFKCKEEDCGKVFSTTIRLSQHLNAHYNNRPFKCPHCDSTFTSQGNAFTHVMVVHEKFRSIRCKLCPKDPGFFKKEYFRKHLEKYHPGRSVEEIIEHKKFADKVRIDYKETLTTYPELFSGGKKRVTH